MLPIIIEITGENRDEVFDMEILGGPHFAVAGAGESHGPGITTIVFGCPPGVRIERAAVQSFLDRRRPGSNRHGTPRHEGDRVVFTAGLFDPDIDTLLAGPEVRMNAGGESWGTSSYEGGFSTGEPIAALVLSTSSKSHHYEQFAGERGEVRPGHTDLVKHYKSRGFVDYRGGGRSSYRSTISDVIGGSVARIFLQETFGTVFLSSICSVGELRAERRLADLFTEPQPSPDLIRETETTLRSAVIHSVDTEFAERAGELIKETRKRGDSLGATVEVVAVNVPPLIGEPLYHSLKARLMGTLGGLHAVQACEIGVGREVVTRRGSENNDPIRSGGYASNNHGGLLGGITTGMSLVARVSFKPTSTINIKQASVRKDLSEVDYELQGGRHDPCVGVRAGVTLESRTATEVMNAVLGHQASRIDPEDFKLF